MKTIITVSMLMILLASHSLSAQTTIGFTAGASFANVTTKFEGGSITGDSKPGITAGVFTDIPISENFSFQPALNFVQKGTKTGDDTYSDKLTLNYLELPLNFTYNNSGFFIGAGPSLSCGLSGKEKYVDKEDPSYSEDTKVEFGSEDDQAKRVEFGANFLAGYKTAGGFLVAVNYNLGLSNLANSDNGDSDFLDGTSVKNKYFAVKIGFVLNGQKKK